MSGTCCSPQSSGSKLVGPHGLCKLCHITSSHSLVTDFTQQAIGLQLLRLAMHGHHHARTHDVIDACTSIKDKHNSMATLLTQACDCAYSSIKCW